MRIQEGHILFFIGGNNDISQGNIFESFILPDVIIFQSKSGTNKKKKKKK